MVSYLTKPRLCFKFGIITQIVQFSKIILVHPKCEIFCAAIKSLILPLLRLQYWTFSIAPCKYIALKLLCFIFSIISLLLFLFALSIVIALPNILILEKEKNIHSKKIIVVILDSPILLLPTESFMGRLLYFNYIYNNSERQNVQTHENFPLPTKHLCILVPPPLLHLICTNFLLWCIKVLVETNLERNNSNKA